MPRDQRWPIAWTTVLMSIHLVASIVLLGVSARLLSGGSYIWSVWSVPQSCITVIATIVHIVCVCTAKLNPAWTLSFYLVLWLSWVALASLVGIWYAYDAYYDGYYYYDSYYSDYYYTYGNNDSILGAPLRMAELVLISICSLTGMALWIFCCVIVNRWRNERAILIARGSQAPIQYVNITYAGYPPGHPLHQPLDPNSKLPLSTHYSMAPGDPNMIQYPHPTQSPPQIYGQYPPPQPIQSPIQLPSSPPPFQPQNQDQVQYPAPVQSPVPIRKPISPSAESDQYPTYYNNHQAT